jgi:hypothetical protein
MVMLKFAGANRLPTSKTLTQNNPGPNVPVVCSAPSRDAGGHSRGGGAVEARRLADAKAQLHRPPERQRR